MNIPQLVNANEVISLTKIELALTDGKTFTGEDFSTIASDKLFEGYSSEFIESWCLDGVECEMLSPNKSWRKGKVKISLEFIPNESDEYEPPLDEIRREMQNQS